MSTGNHHQVLTILTMASSCTSTSSKQGTSLYGQNQPTMNLKRSPSSMDVSGPPAVANKRPCTSPPAGKPRSSPYGSTMAAAAPMDVPAPVPAAAALNVQGAPADYIMDSPHSPGTEKLVNFLVDPRSVSSPEAMAAACQMENDFNLFSPNALNNMGWNGDDAWKRDLPSHLQFIKTEEDLQTLRVDEYSVDDLNQGAIECARRYSGKLKEFFNFLLHKHTTRRESAKPGYDRLFDRYVNNEISMDTLCHSRNGMLLREQREVAISTFHYELTQFLESYEHKLAFPEEPPSPPADYELVPLRAIRFGDLYLHHKNHRGTTTQGASSIPMWGVVARDDKDCAKELTRVNNEWVEVIS